MLHNLLDALDDAGLQHVTLLQGVKAYGVHLGQIPVLARENAPRHLHPNFYWAQEDLLRARPSVGGWRWTMLRPQAVLGFAEGSAMNMVAAIGAYVAISRARCLPLVYSGQGHRVTEATDVRLLARALAWAGESPAAADQIFNVTNGDVLVWQNPWPVVAQQFGMEVGLPDSGRHPYKHLPYPKVTDPAALPIRPERHVDLSMTTLRIVTARTLARTLPRCPCCQQKAIDYDL